MISALVLAGVMFIALDVGWIARLGAALAGRVGQAALLISLSLQRQRQPWHRPPAAPGP
jgi:hypothetical protein